MRVRFDMLKLKVIFIAAMIFTLTMLVLTSSRVQTQEMPYKIITKEYNQPFKKYSVNFKYPQIEASPLTKAQIQFNQLMLDQVNKAVKDFQAQLEGENPKPEQFFSLLMDYQTKFQSDNLISIFISGLNYFGGAHPQHLFSTVLFDLKQGKALELKELFAPQSDYLNFIGKYCESFLAKREHADFELIKNGTAAKEENYKYFYLNPDGLVVIFPPYQVACYSEGTFEITIPYPELKSLVAPGGALAPLAK
jgi:hypothetical protein